MSAGLWSDLGPSTPSKCAMTLMCRKMSCVKWARTLSQLAG